MKRKLIKLWGIGLVVVLLSSLLIAATPASAAEPLRWEMKVDAPSGIPGVQSLLTGSDILDFAFDSSGMTMYAATGTGLYQSVTGGSLATEISSRLPSNVPGDPGTVAENIDIDTIDLVAMAPDDPNVAVVVDASSDATPNYVSAAITTDGGATWTSMGVIQDASGNRPTTALGVEISPLVAGNVRYISIYGRDAADTAAGNGAALYYYNFGAGIGAWADARADFVNTPSGSANLDNIVAMAFSPGFAADYMAVALSEQIASATANGSLTLHILSFNSRNWDTGVASGYGVSISANTSAAAFDVTSASVALHPDYDGGDEALRISFVGAAITLGTDEVGGIWRCRDVVKASIFGGAATSGVGINSIAFDGTNLAAGAYETNNVYRCADPMATSPTVMPARSYKKIGEDDAAADKVQVMFIGETLYGAKVGAASAVSKSVDYGNTWNDYTLMDSALSTITDILPTAAGDPWYLAAYDGGETSIYRMSMFSVQKVLCVTGTYDLMLRGVADNPDVVYAADEGSTTIFYTADAGLTRWYKRTAPKNVADMAVESDDVVYVGQSGGISVYKSITKGFTWSTAIDTKLTSNINTILSIGENDLLVGGLSGSLNYTQDGGSTWTKTFGILFGGPVQIAATGLNAGDYIFLSDENDNSVWRCEIGPANPLGEFKTMNAPSQVNNETNKGLVLYKGVLYAVSANGTDTYLIRTLAPTVPGTHLGLFWGTRFVDNITYTPAGSGPYLNTNEFSIDSSPSALKASDGPPGSIVLYGVETKGTIFAGAVATPAAYYLDDAIALSGPELIGPADGSLIQMNSITGYPHDVNFTWARPSKATNYALFVALDAGFTELIQAPPYSTGTNTYNTVSKIITGETFQPGTTYYWRVCATEPLYSTFSETRSFTVQPGAAAVPTIGSPANGSQTADENPAFSWSPVSGANKYEFQLAVSTNFATPLYSDTIAETGIRPAVKLDPGTTYFWRVRAVDPVMGDWSTIANFTVATEAPPPPEPVVIEQVPPPVIEIPPAQAVPDIVIPEPPPATEPINDAYILAIIIIGAVLVIAVIVLIVRTRRTV